MSNLNSPLIGFVKIFKIFFLLSFLVLFSGCSAPISNDIGNTDSDRSQYASSDSNFTQHNINTIDHNTKIQTKFGFSILVPDHAQYGTNFVAYVSPEIFVSEDFIEHRNEYYDFSITDEEQWEGDIVNLGEKFCFPPASTPGEHGRDPSIKSTELIEETYEVPNENVTLIRMKIYCGGYVFFALHNSRLFKIQAGPDTVDEDGIWEVLKTIQFDA